MKINNCKIIFKSAFVAIVTCTAMVTSAYATSFNFIFSNQSYGDIIIEPVNQTTHPGHNPDDVWSTCMGKNWFTPDPPVQIAHGKKYTVQDVETKGCGPSVNTWKVSNAANKNLYGYIQFINNYSININNGAFSALIRNFVGVGNDNDPVKQAHPLAVRAICHVKSDKPCLDKNIKMVKGGDIDILIRDGILQ